MKNKVVLCIGDSMAMPRPNIDYKSTWPCLLKSYFDNFDFVNLFHRGFTSENLVNSWEGDYLEFYNPNTVILQLGIVDCSPRFLKRNTNFYKILNRMPKVIQNVCWWYLKKFRSRKISNCDVSSIDFYENIKKYIIRCYKSNVEKIFIISINRCSEMMTTKSPFINDSIDKHNNEIYKLATEFSKVCILSPLSIPEDKFYVDGYHPSKIGHYKIFESLINELNA